MITFKSPVNLKFSKDNGLLDFHVFPGRPYVFSGGQSIKILSTPQTYELTEKVTDVIAREAPFTVYTPPKGDDNLLFYCGAGGYGDQLLAAPVAKYLADKGWKIHILCEPSVEDCWASYPWVCSTLSCPIDYGVFSAFRHKALFDSVTNFDEHVGQLHPVDALFTRLGVDPDSIAPADKACRPILHPSELARSSTLDLHFGVYQLAASSPVRSLDSHHSALILKALATQYPMKWFAAHSSHTDSAYMTAAAALNCANVDVIRFSSIRDVLLVSRLATLVVAPDSLFVHSAGNFGTPCVGLWGSHDPQLRTAYYVNHAPVLKRSACAKSPCMSNRPEFPTYCPPNVALNKECAVLSAITPDDVVGASMTLNISVPEKI